MQRRASAIWRGGLKDGVGTISTHSRVMVEAPYAFATRFEGLAGTNPEELIAAAHASCFAMALAGQLGDAGLMPESIQATATVTLDKTDKGWTVTESHLDVTARVPDADREAFDKAARAAKEGCPISRLLNAKVTMDARLEAISRAG